MKEEHPLRILSLETVGYRRVNAVRIALSPDDHTVFVCGDNDNGKSSTLRSILDALQGGKTSGDPVRAGSEKAEIRITLGDQLPDIMVRKIYKKGQPPKLVVRRADGSTGNQASLDDIVGAISVDPAALAAMDGKAQAKAVQQALGLDFTDLDKAQADTFAARTDVNRRIRDLEGELKGKELHPSTPKDPLDTATLMDELRQRQAKREENNATRRALDEAIREGKQAKAEVLRIEEEIEELKRQITEKECALAAANRTVTAAIESYKSRKAAVDALTDPDTSDLEHQISQAADINRKVAENKALFENRTRLCKLRAESDEMTEKLQQIEADRKARIAKAKIPGLEDISFGPDGLLYEGFLLKDLGTGKGLRVCTQIALAMNPKLRVVLIRAGNDLDKKNLAMICEAAQQANAQVWIEKVEKPTDGTIVEITDGNGTYGEAKNGDEDNG